MTLRRTAFWCGGGLAILVGIAVLTVALAVYEPRFRRPLVQWALAPRGGSASLAGLHLAVSPPALTLEGLAIEGPSRQGDLLRLDHLRVELLLGRFFRGGPWLRRVEARGLIFERLRPRATEGRLDLAPLAWLFKIEDLSLTDSRLRLALLEGTLAADALRLSLTPGQEGVRRFNGTGELTFRRDGSTVAGGKLTAQGTATPGPALAITLELTSARLDLPWFAGDVFGQASLRLTQRGVQIDDLGLRLPEARLSLSPGAPQSLAPIRLGAAGSMTLDGRDPRLELREADIGGLLQAHGRLSGRTLEDLSGAVDGAVPRVERLRALLAPLAPSRLKALDLAGELPFRLSLTAQGTERVLALELLPRELVFSWPDEGLSCRFGGALRAAGPLGRWLHARPNLDGQLQGTGHLERPPLAVRLFRLDASLAGDLTAPSLPRWQLSAAAGDVLYGGRALPLGALDVRGSATAAGRSLRVEGLDIGSETLGHLTGGLAIPEGGGSPEGRLDGRSLPAAALLSLAGALTGRDWQGWSPGGSVDVAARLEPMEGGARVAAAIALDHIGCTSPAGDVMSQNLAGKIDLEARLGPQPRLEAGLTLGRGEALWGTVYVNLASAPLGLRFGVTRTGQDKYKDLTVDGGLAGFGRVTLRGEARREAGRWRHQGQFALSEAQLGPVFRTFLRDPLAASHPGLAGLQTAGTAQLDLSFSGTEKATDLDGRLRLRSGEIRREGAPPLLLGLDLDLPIAYALGAPDPARPRPPETAGWGRLSLKELRLAGQELAMLEMPVVLVPNRLYFGHGIEAPLFGAKLFLRRIQVQEPLSPGFRIRLAAQLDGLDLARLAGQNPALEGHLGGLLEPVSISRERLTAAGDLTGDFFGGQIGISQLMVDRPFGSGRELGADVKVSRLDLERLSAALNVGRITGRVSGSLEDLRVAYGQPVAFHLKMESVPTKDVTQRVSLKAVNAISLLSTGSTLGGLGLSVMTALFREFPYEKIGFECDLKNDVFTVRGLIRENGVEYLVKRPLFSGINVINRNPDNRIRFSDMLDRAKRVTSEGSH